MSDLMTAYLDQLTRELSFDPSLARRMRAEAEDHLQEAVASDPMGVTTEAERRAIARFGAARDIAAQCAVPLLVKQVKNAGAAATLIAVGVLIAMKSALQPMLRLRRLSATIRLSTVCAPSFSTIDRYAFWCGLLIAICGWAYISIVCASDEARLVWPKRLRLSLLTYAAAAVAVVITVASDTIITGAQVVAGRTGRDPVSVPDHWA